MKLRLFPVSFVALSALLVMGGCSELKEDAIEAGIEIKQMCVDKKLDEANTAGVALYEKNVVFKQAIDDSAVVWKIKDIATYNYCGPGFETARRKMAEAKAPDGCSCRVVGAGEPNHSRGLGAGWLLGALGVALMSRRRRRAA